MRRPRPPIVRGTSIVLVTIGVAVSLSFVGSSARPDWDGRDLTLAWSDEFNAPALDEGRWKVVEGDFGTPYRLQTYTERSTNLHVSGGQLVMEARREQWAGRDYTSAMVVSNDIERADAGPARGNRGWTEGRFELRARLPSAPGLWPALWLRPIDHRYGPWPDSGEIDIVDHPGPVPIDESDAPPFVAAGLHSWSGDRSGGSHQQVGRVVVTPEFFDDFHVWAMDWDRRGFRWQVDGRTYHEVIGGWSAPNAPFPAPFDEPFFLTLNLQVGGWAGEPAATALPASLEVDYVRVYQ